MFDFGTSLFQKIVVNPTLEVAGPNSGTSVAHANPCISLTNAIFTHAATPVYRSMGCYAGVNGYAPVTVVRVDPDITRDNCINFCYGTSLYRYAGRTRRVGCIGKRASVFVPMMPDAQFLILALPPRAHPALK